MARYVVQFLLYNVSALFLSHAYPGGDRAHYGGEVGGADGNDRAVQEAEYVGLSNICYTDTR